MRIATFNVNSLKARLGFVLHWLNAREPDVVCVQELKLADDKFPHAELEALGYRAYVHGQAQWNGVAILSRMDGEVLERGLPGADELGARLIGVRVGDTKFTSVYVPNGKTVQHPDYQLKLRFLDRLVAHLRETTDPGSRAVVAGDFNIAPEDIDSWDPERLAGSIFHTAEERRRIDALRDLGLADLYRQKNPDGRMFSWWDYRAGCFHKNEGLRIDLLLATAPILAITNEVLIDRDYRKKKDGQIPSDHAPVIALLSR